MISVRPIFCGAVGFTGFNFGSAGSAPKIASSAGASVAASIAPTTAITRFERAKFAA
jgi:hypothetical protein